MIRYVDIYIYIRYYNVLYKWYDSDIYIYIQGAQNAKTKNLPQTKSQVCTILLSEEKKQAQNNLEPGARSVVKTDLDIQQFPLGLNSMSLQYRVHVYMYIYIYYVYPRKFT